MSLIDRGQSALTARQQKAATPAGPLAYYRQAGGDPIDLTGKAWVGRTMFRVSDPNKGSRVVWSDRDYLVPAALGAAPQVGDWFEETFPDGTIRVFEVLPYANEPAWRYSDPQQTLYRIHCKAKT